MERFEKVKLTNENYDEESEKLEAFKEHIEGLSEKERTAEMVTLINGLTNPDNKRLATYLLGETEIDQAAAVRLVSYISNYENSDQQVGVAEYLDEMRDYEEDLTGEARDTDVDVSLYGYEVADDVAREIESIKNSSGRDLSEDDIRNIAVARATVSRVENESLYFRGSDSETKKDDLDFLRATLFFDGDIKYGIASAAEEIYGKEKSWRNTTELAGINPENFLKAAFRLKEDMVFIGDCYDAYLANLAEGERIIAAANGAGEQQ